MWYYFFHGFEKKIIQNTEIELLLIKNALNNDILDAIRNSEKS